MKTRYKDRLGFPIYEGDILLYSTSSMTSGRISCFKVLGETKEKLKVTRGTNSYSGKPMVSYINHPEDCVVLNNMQDPQDVFDIMNKE